MLLLPSCCSWGYQKSLNKNLCDHLLLKSFAWPFDVMFMMTDDRENKEKQNSIDITLPDTKEVWRFSNLIRLFSWLNTIWFLTQLAEVRIKQVCERNHFFFIYSKMIFLSNEDDTT